MTDWRITLHWTAGTNKVSELDRQHYHYIIGGDCTATPGEHVPADNLSISDGDYAAHVLNCNTANIGVAIAGMAGAIESPLSVGDYPITEGQFKAAVVKIAALAKQYSIPVTDTRILTHAEIEPNLQIKQKGKWDITVLPWDYTIRGHRAVGDYLRAKVAAELGSAVLATTETPATTSPVLRMGSSNTDAVKVLQKLLRALGYYTGTVDGIFGSGTRAAVISFQETKDLDADGVVGRNTWLALRT